MREVQDRTQVTRLRRTTTEERSGEELDESDGNKEFDRL